MTNHRLPEDSETADVGGGAGSQEWGGSMLHNGQMISERELRMNHEFVSAFEKLRRGFNLWDMHDQALRQISDATSLEFEALRRSRHLRNALAHDQPVNREALEHHLAILRGDGAEARAQTEVALAGRSDVERADNRPDSGQRRFFRLHAWRNPELEAQMLAHGFVSVGGGEIGDMTAFSDAEDINAALTESMSDRTAPAIRLFVGYWRRFLWDARIGDVVVLPTQTKGVAIGTFSGPYFYVESASERARHRRLVDWREIGVAREVLSEPVNRVLSGRHTVQTIKPELHAELLAVAGLS